MSENLSKIHLSDSRKNLLLMTNNHIIALMNLRDKVMGRGYSPHHVPFGKPSYRYSVIAPEIFVDVLGEYLLDLTWDVRGEIIIDDRVAYLMGKDALARVIDGYEYGSCLIIVIRLRVILKYAAAEINIKPQVPRYYPQYRLDPVNYPVHAA